MQLKKLEMSWMEPATLTLDLNFPSRHTTSFQRLSDAYTTSPTSYRRLIDVETTLCVCWNFTL